MGFKINTNTYGLYANGNKPKWYDVGETKIWKMALGVAVVLLMVIVELVCMDII